MMRRIDARRYPTIRGIVRDMKSQGVDGRYAVTGDLTFHGVTQTVEGEVSVSRPDDGTLVIEGEHTFDIRDFKVDPPKILMLKVHPEVKVRIRVEAVGENVSNAGRTFKCWHWQDSRSATSWGQRKVKPAWSG